MPTRRAIPPSRLVVTRRIKLENRSHIAAAVAFILILGCAAIGFYLWLSSGDDANRQLVIETSESAGGVTADSPVKFKGLKVGHIVSVGFDPHDPSKIRILFKIRESVPVTTSSYAELTSQGITGLSTLTLFTPKPSAKPLTGKLPQVPLRPGLLDKLEKQGKTDLARISQILDQVTQLTGPKNTAHIQNTLAQLDKATRQLTADEQSLQPVLAQLPHLTRQLSATVQQIHDLTRQAIPAIQKAGAAAQSAQGLGRSGQHVMRQLDDQVLPHIDALTQQMNQTARQIQDLSSELASKPNSLLTGPPKQRPGPGERGFKAPGR